MKLEHFYYGEYNKKCKDYGFDKFTGEHKYDSSKMGEYESEILEIYEENKKDFVVIFCKIDVDGLYEGAHTLTLGNEIEKNEMIEKMLKKLKTKSDKKRDYLKNILTNAIYGEIYMASYV